MRFSNIISINAILYATENGCKWHALPKRFGNWFTVYAWFRRWYRSGVLEHLFAELREWQVVGEDTECFGLGRTGARKTNGPQSFGNSRGGWNTKIHMVSANDRLGMIFRLSGGQAHDAPEKVAPCWTAGTSRSRTHL